MRIAVLALMPTSPAAPVCVAHQDQPERCPRLLRRAVAGARAARGQFTDQVAHGYTREEM